MQGEKSTCLSQHKATLMLFRSCSLKLPNFRSTARSSTRSKHRAQTCKADKQEQLRQYTNQEKALKKEQGLAQGPRTQKHSGLSGDLDDHIQQLAMCLVYFN
jgi:hypothetical protein